MRVVIGEPHSEMDVSRCCGQLSGGDCLVAVGIIDKQGPKAQLIGLPSDDDLFVRRQSSEIDANSHECCPSMSGTSSVPIRSITSVSALRGGWS